MKSLPHSRVLTIVAALAGLILALLLFRSPTTEPSVTSLSALSEESVLIRVDNENLDRCTIYLVRAGGAKYRLGDVDGLSKAAFRVPLRNLDGRTVRLGLRIPIEITTIPLGEVDVAPGFFVSVVIEPIMSGTYMVVFPLPGVSGS